MKIKIINALTAILLLSTAKLGFSQGFVNLNFESANIPNGTQPGSPVPISSGLPGWSGSFSNVNGTVQATQVTYQGISLGGVAISIIDTNAAQYGFDPLQGIYSAFLFGGLSSGGDPTSATISQTGVVPNGTMSLLMDVYGGSFTVTLGGQTLSMVPLQTFPSYTLYGADISGFAGLSAQLSITAPPTGFPNGELLDDIIFSSNPIPEPSSLSLFALGGLLFGWRRWRNTSR